MAITTNTLETTKLGSSTITSRWIVNASSADASGCEVVKAAPGSGYELMLSYLRLTIGGSVNATIGAGEESSAVKRTVIGPIGGAAMTLEFNWRDAPVVLDPNASLTVDSSGAGVISVYVEGLTRVQRGAGVVSASPSSSPSTSPSASISASVSSSTSA